MRFLVTGGAGFIGSAVCRLLVKEGHTVLNIDCLTYAGRTEALEEVRDSDLYNFLREDICNYEPVQIAIQRFRPDSILHLAAETHVDRSIADPSPFVRSNILGTYSLLEAARHYWTALTSDEKDRFRFVHVSTDEVYGSTSEGFFSEESRYDPSSPYSASKAGSDHLCLAWHRTFDLPVVVTHCSNNYGPFQLADKLIPVTITRALQGHPLPIYGDGLNVRDWLYVDDHARALLMLATAGRPGEIYNIGAHCERTNLDVAGTICAILDGIHPENSSHAQLITFVADRRGHDRRYAIDARKLVSELGWQPRESFETGLENTVRWFMENRWWWETNRH